jgi:hypothetical protein
MTKHRGNVGRVLNYLKTHKGGITSMQAFEKFGVTRLSVVIFVLRKEYEIIGEKCFGKNRFGDKVRFVKFKLVGEV